MSKTNRTRVSASFVAFFQAGFLLWLTLERTEIPLLKDGERLIFGLIDNTRNFLNIPPDTANLNPYVFINVSHDKRLQIEPDGGRTVETDYDRLADLLTILAQPQKLPNNQVRFVFCDLFVDESRNLPPTLLRAITTLTATNKILFASRQDGLRSDAMNAASNYIPRALSVYDDQNQYLIHYPLVLGDSSGVTAPLALYNKVNEAGVAHSPVKDSFLPWFNWRGEYHFRKPIVNHYLLNEDVGGANEKTFFVKHNLYQLLKHKQLGDSLSEYGLADKIVVIADLDAETLDDKHLTTVNETTFGVLTILNTWEMIRRGETRTSGWWLVTMFTLVFMASYATIYLNAFVDHPLNKIENINPWLKPWRWLSNYIRPKLSFARGKQKPKPAGQISQVFKWIDTKIIRFSTGSSFKEHWKGLLGDLVKLVGFGGFLCLFSYCLFGIKIEFFLITSFLFVEGIWLRRRRGDRFDYRRRANWRKKYAEKNGNIKS